MEFDSFWAETLASARQHKLEPKFVPVSTGLKLVEVFDVTFPGFGGQPIKGWFILPMDRPGKRPCVVEYIGYGGGRALPTDWLLWANAGYAHFVMDTRGQGSTWSPGDTSDQEPEGSNPQIPGFMTRGVLDPKTYYYRRVFIDAVRAIETARTHPAVDAARIAVTGGSQGGGITLAVAGLVPDLARAGRKHSDLFEIVFWEAMKHKKPYVAIELFPPDTMDQVLANHKKSIEYLRQNF